MLAKLYPIENAFGTLRKIQQISANPADFPSILIPIGTYYINRLFATVEFIKKTVIPVGFVGVVVSYTGKKGMDLSGNDYSHGELVDSASRGVWRDPLMPGKYAFNTYAGKIELVPTTNFVLITKQKELTGSLVDISIKENQGSANVKAAEKKRQEIEALAHGERFKQDYEGGRIR